MKSEQIALGRPDNWTVWGLSRKSQQFFLLFPFFLRPLVVEILHSGRSQRSVCYQPAIKIQSAVGLIHEQSPLVANWNNLDTSLWLFIKGSGTTKSWTNRWLWQKKWRLGLKWITLKCTSIDSSWNTLFKFFWSHFDPSSCSAANSAQTWQLLRSPFNEPQFLNA